MASECGKLCIRWKVGATTAQVQSVTPTFTMASSSMGGSLTPDQWILARDATFDMGEGGAPVLADKRSGSLYC